MAQCNKPDPNLNLPRQAVIDWILGFIETFAVPGGEDKRRWGAQSRQNVARDFLSPFLHFKASNYLIWIIYSGPWWRAQQKGIDWTDLGPAARLNAILFCASRSVGGLSIQDSVIKSINQSVCNKVWVWKPALVIQLNTAS